MKKLITAFLVCLSMSSAFAQTADKQFLLNLRAVNIEPLYLKDDPMSVNTCTISYVDASRTNASLNFLSNTSNSAVCRVAFSLLGGADLGYIDVVKSSGIQSVTFQDPIFYARLKWCNATSSFQGDSIKGVVIIDGHNEPCL